MADVLIPALEPFQESLANGTQTEFGFDFVIFDPAHLLVYVDNVLQTGGYSVVPLTSWPGPGKAVFASPPVGGKRIGRERASPIQRLTDFQEGGDFRAGTLNNELDYLTVVAQEQALVNRRSLRQPSNETPFDPLPAAAVRAAGILGFGSAGEPIIIPWEGNPAAFALSFETRAKALLAAIPAAVQYITIYHGHLKLDYKRDAAGTAFTSADGQKWSPLPGQWFCPQHFDALGDGTTDDAPAINLAFAHLKTVVATSRGHKLLFPPAVYKIQASIGAHGIVPYLNAHTTVVEGYGAKILVNTDDLHDKVILDIRGSTNLHLKGLEISAAVLSADEPLVGIAWGRTSSTLPNNCDRNYLEDVRVHGRYGLAPAYNSQSEVNGVYNCQFLNSSTSTGSKAVVLDGINHFNVPSDFTTLTLATDTIGSLQTPVFVNCWFASNAGGTACIWLSSAVFGAKFVGGYALNQTAGSVFDLYVLNDTDAAAIKNLDCQELHVENTNVANMFNITGPATAPIIQGLQYTDNYCFATDAVFARDSTQTVTLDDLHLRIATFPASPDPDIFDDPSKFTVTPKIISLPSSYVWQFPSRSLVSPAFTGTAITTTGAFVMAGFGADSGGSGANPAVFTPRISGKVRITITGAIRNSIALSGAIFRIQYGTGAAPAINAVTAGSVTSAINQMVSASANQLVPFHLEATVAGLTLGTQIWADLGIQAVTSGNVFVVYPGVSFEEI